MEVAAHEARDPRRIAALFDWGQPGHAGVDPHRNELSPTPDCNLPADARPGIYLIDRPHAAPGWRRARRSIVIAPGA